MGESEPTNPENVPNFESPDFYERLGIQKDASPEDISSAYRGAAKNTHPDSGGDSNHFKRVQEAFDVLNDPKKRTEYDRNFTESANPSSSEKYRSEQRQNQTEKPDINGLVQAWKLIEEANAQLEKGVPVTNINELKNLKRFIDRYMDNLDLLGGSDKDLKLAESLSDEIEGIIDRHDDLEEKKREEELNKVKDRLDDIYEEKDK